MVYYYYVLDIKKMNKELIYLVAVFMFMLCILNNVNSWGNQKKKIMNPYLWKGLLIRIGGFILVFGDKMAPGHAHY